ncbi:MAG: hypothetical protein HPAVJP_5390 [Candidatus Hepatoplasma vulgare]|nr:MAG: hypothetical protein HPAVJP_5390 [Candidatus Hepatoplasma sp.]
MENKEKVETILEIKNLSINMKSYKKIDSVLNNINFTIKKNEIVGIVGESGAGKTTLAKTILGYNKFYEGKIIINEKLIPTHGIKNINNKNRWIYETVQMIFENAASSLNPNDKIKTILKKSFKDFGILEKEEEKELEILYQNKKEIENKLFKYKYPEKYNANKMINKVDSILKSEKDMLYKETEQKQLYYEKKIKLKEINNNIKNSKLSKKKYRLTYREKIKFLREEKFTEIRKIKKNYEQDKKIASLSFKDEKYAILYLDSEYFLKKLNFSLIFSELTFLLKTFQKLFKKDIDFKIFLEKPDFELEKIKSIEDVKKNKKEIIIYLNYLLSEKEKFPIIEKYSVRINYIKNLLFEKSPINSIPFKKFMNHFTDQINKRLEEQSEIIENLEKYIDFLKIKNKRITNKELILLKKDEILSLNYELVLFREIKKMFLKFLEDSKEEIYNHNLNNLKSFYKTIYFYNNKICTVYLSLMSWKFKNQRKFFKKEYTLQKKADKARIINLKKEKKELVKVLVKNKWIEKNINEKLDTLKENLVNNIKKRGISNFEKEETFSFEITKKIRDLESQRIKILEDIKIIENLYSKKNKENIFKEKILDIFEILNLPINILDYYPFQFPNSIKHKILIAKALVSNPKLIIADESVTSLDSITKFEIIEILKLIKEKYKISILFITNDFGTTKYISDRVYVFQYGSIVEYGTANYIFNYPIHPYTKFFLNKTSVNKSEQKQIDYSMRDDKIQIYNRYKNVITFEVQNNHFVNGTLLEIEKWLNNSNLKRNVKNVKSI